MQDRILVSFAVNRRAEEIGLHISESITARSTAEGELVCACRWYG
jgi:hypothetical protein